MKKFKKIKGALAFEFIVVLGVIVAISIPVAAKLTQGVTKANEETVVLLNLPEGGGSITPVEPDEGFDYVGPDRTPEPEVTKPEIKEELVRLMQVLPSSAIQNQRHSVTVPGLKRLVNVTSNTGESSVISENGSTISLSLENGKLVKKELVSGDLNQGGTKWVTGQHNKNYQDSEGYFGTLESYVAGSIGWGQGEKFVTAQTSPDYSDDEGYTGTLEEYLQGGTIEGEEKRTFYDQKEDRIETKEGIYTHTEGIYKPEEKKNVEASEFDKYKNHIYSYDHIGGDFVPPEYRDETDEKYDYSKYEQDRYEQISGSYTPPKSKTETDERFRNYDDEYWKSVQTGGTVIPEERRVETDSKLDYQTFEEYKYQQTGGYIDYGRSKTATETGVLDHYRYDYWESYHSGGSIIPAESKRVIEERHTHNQINSYRCEHSGGSLIPGATKTGNANRHNRYQMNTYTCNGKNYTHTSTRMTSASASSTLWYNDGTYTGYLSQAGETYRSTGGNPGKCTGRGKVEVQAYDYRMNYSGTVRAPDRDTRTYSWSYTGNYNDSVPASEIYYNSGGFSGYLARSEGKSVSVGGNPGSCSSSQSGQTTTVRTYNLYSIYSGIVKKPLIDARTYSWRFYYTDVDSSSAPYSRYYNSGGYSGYLYKDGEVYYDGRSAAGLPTATSAGQVIRRYTERYSQNYSGTVWEPDRDYRTWGWVHNRTYSSASSAPATIRYNSGGFSGNLTKLGSVFEKSKDTKAWPSNPSVGDTHARFISDMWQNYSGTVIKPEQDIRKYGWEYSHNISTANQAPDYIDYDSEKYVGKLLKTTDYVKSKETYDLPTPTKAGLEEKKERSHIWQRYSGTVTKPAVDTRKYAWVRFPSGDSQTASKAPGFISYSDGVFEGRLNKEGAPYEKTSNIIDYPLSPTVGQVHNKVKRDFWQKYSGEVEKPGYDVRVFDWVFNKFEETKSQAPAKYLYDKDGFKGELEKSKVLIEEKFETKEFPQNPKEGDTHKRFIDKHTQYYSGEVISPEIDTRVYEWVFNKVKIEHFNPPLEIEYDDGNFKGTLYKDGPAMLENTETLSLPENPKEGDVADMEINEYVQNYSGEVVSPFTGTETIMYQGTVTREALDEDLIRYKGWVEKETEDTRVYEDVYQYIVTITYWRDQK